MLRGATTGNRVGWLDESMPDDANVGTGPVDPEILDRIAQRLTASDRFSTVAVQPDSAPNAVLADFERQYYPATVSRVYLQIRWFTTDDFSIHYVEQYTDGEMWECRWDRHPNDHNTREHLHPPPDAATPGTDATYPADWRDVLARVLNRLDERIHAFWE